MTANQARVMKFGYRCYKCAKCNRDWLRRVDNSRYIRSFKGLTYHQEYWHVCDTCGFDSRFVQFQPQEPKSP